MFEQNSVPQAICDSLDSIDLQGNPRAEGKIYLYLEVGKYPVDKSLILQLASR